MRRVVVVVIGFAGVLAGAPASEDAAVEPER
jgi:hypothetical protein